MPLKRIHRKNNKPPIAGAMAGCVFPQSVMFNIVTRLPVRSIHRYKAVCKPWYKLFATPKFMKTHHAQLSRNPQYQSVLIYRFLAANGGHTVSLFRIESSDEKPINLDHPFPQHLYHMDFVGCCNGLLCLAYPMHLYPMPAQRIELWNPALKLSKTLPLPKLEIRGPTLVSIGLGYDDESDEFKVVRIVHVGDREKQGKETIVAGVEVYSANSNSWRIIDVRFQFSVALTRNQAIVNGNPYWVGKVDDNEVLVTFDMRKMVFEIVPLTGLNLGKGEHVKLPIVDWKGEIAALICKKNDGRFLSLEVWVFDNGGKVWIKNRSFGPIVLRVDRFVQCLKNGEIVVGECLEDGKVFLLDAAEEENGGGVKKEIVIDGDDDDGSFQIHGYTESLAYFKGMEKVKVEPYKKGNDWKNFWWENMAKMDIQWPEQMKSKVENPKELSNEDQAKMPRETMCLSKIINLSPHEAFRFLEDNMEMSKNGTQWPTHFQCHITPQMLQSCTFIPKSIRPRGCEPCIVSASPTSDKCNLYFPLRRQAYMVDVNLQGYRIIGQSIPGKGKAWLLLAHCTEHAVVFFDGRQIIRLLEDLPRWADGNGSLLMGSFVGDPTEDSYRVLLVLCQKNKVKTAVYHTFVGWTKRKKHRIGTSDVLPSGGVTTNSGFSFIDRASQQLVIFNDYWVDPDSPPVQIKLNFSSVGRPQVISSVLSGGELHSLLVVKLSPVRIRLCEIMMPGYQLRVVSTLEEGKIVFCSGQTCGFIASIGDSHVGCESFLPVPNNHPNEKIYVSSRVGDCDVVDCGSGFYRMIKKCYNPNEANTCSCQSCVFLLDEPEPNEE